MTAHGHEMEGAARGVPDMTHGPPSYAAGGRPSPFFIMGCSRSGTSLVSRILDSHSRMAVYLETHYYPLFRPDLHRYGDLRRAPNLVRLIADLREVLSVHGRMPPPEVGEFLEALIAPTFEGVLGTLLHLYATRQGKVRGGEKTPGHAAYLAEILERFPESPVIYLVRDPRDTVFFLRDDYGTSLQGGAWLWNEAFLSYRRSSRPVHLVRYEELVRQPAEVVGAMCGFLGEQYEPGMLRFFQRVRGPSHAIPPTHRELLEPIHARGIGRFRQMSADEIEWIEAACAEGMEEMSYPFTTSQRRVVTMAPPSRLHVVLDRLRFYSRGDRARLRRGWIRWKIVLRVRARYVLSLGWLRNRRRAAPPKEARPIGSVSTSGAGRGVTDE